MINLQSIVALVLLALSYAAPDQHVSQSESRRRYGKTYIASRDLILSHLSPLIQYRPEHAWTITRYEAQTIQSGANVSIDFMGTFFTVLGRQERADFDISPPIPERYRPDDPPNYRYNQSIIGPRSQVFILGPTSEVQLRKRKWSLALPEEGPGSIHILAAEYHTALPINAPEFVEGEYESIQTLPVVDPRGSVHPLFRNGLSKYWTIDRLGYGYGAFAIVNNRRFYGDPASIVWGGDYVLTTRTAHSPLRFAVPGDTSLIQVYGTVGLEYGTIQLRLIPHGRPVDLSLHGLVQDSNTRRPINTQSELLTLAYLDPRIAYDAELSLVENGKRVDVQGIVFTNFIEEPMNITRNWLEEYNERYGYKGADEPDSKAESNTQRTALILVAAVLLVLLLVDLILRRRRSGIIALGDSEAEE